MNYLAKDATEMLALGRAFARTLKGGEVVCLFGDLGFGKTTFVRGVIDYFLPGQRVISPTFILSQEYHPLHKHIHSLFHIDLYRLSGTKEIDTLGLSDLFFQPNAVVFLEWAERLETSRLPIPRIDIIFRLREDGTREVCQKTIQ